MVFKKGDRVVHIEMSGRRKHGTVIAIRTRHHSINSHTSHQITFLDVIYDDGSRSEDETCDFWLESEYDPDIPF